MLNLVVCRGRVRLDYGFEPSGVVGQSHKVVQAQVHIIQPIAASSIKRDGPGRDRVGA